MSRTKKKYIYIINQKELNNKYENRHQSSLELTNSRFKGKIYKVTFDNDLIYIGSTCEELETRFKWHLSNKSNKLLKHKHKDSDKNPRLNCLFYAQVKIKRGLKRSKIDLLRSMLINMTKNY